MTTDVLTIGNTRLTRVGYADVSIPPERIGLAPEKVASLEWAQPPWADADGVRAGAAVWIIESGDVRIAVDPAQAADEILRTDADAAFHQEAFAAVMTDAGFPRESITHAVATHIGGVGMFAWRNDDGSWSPFFPNAPLLVSQRELDAVDSGPAAVEPLGIIAQFRAEGVVEVLTGECTQLTDDVSIEFTGGHTLGHQIVRIDSGNESAVMLGHLAVSPLNLAPTGHSADHVDEPASRIAVDRLLAEDVILVGPLWPAPGAGRWDRENQALRPVSER